MVFLAIFLFSGGSWKEGAAHCSLSASAGSGVSTGLLGKGPTPVFLGRRPTNPTQPHLSSSGIAPVPSGLPPHPRDFSSSLRGRQSSTMQSARQKRLNFLCLTRGNPIDSPPSLRAPCPHPMTEFLCQRVNLESVLLSTVRSFYGSLVFAYNTAEDQDTAPRPPLGDLGSLTGLRWLCYHGTLWSRCRCL